MKNSTEKILQFNIEVCTNCSKHGWYTRHDEKKYQDHYLKCKIIII